MLWARVLFHEPFFNVRVNKTKERERETPQAFELVKLLLNIQYSLNLIWYNYEFRKTVVRLGNDFFSLDSSRRLTITLINCEIDYHLECEWACWIFGTRNARMRKHVLQLCQVIDSIFMLKLTKRPIIHCFDWNSFSNFKHRNSIWQISLAH